MKRKIKVNVMLLIGLSFLALTMVQPVNAEDEQSVQSIIEQVQEHNLREEDVQEELEQLSMSELKDIQEYLANKHDVTMIEKQVLNLTQELLGEGSSVGYVAQESLQTSDRKEALKLEAEEIVNGLSEEERNSARKELKSIKDKSIEEEVMYDVLTKMEIIDNLSSLLIKGVVFIIVGAIFKVYDKWKGDIVLLSRVFGNTFAIVGVIMIAFALTIRLIII